MKLLDREQLYRQLRQCGHDRWAQAISDTCSDRLRGDRHGSHQEWSIALDQLPEVADARLDASGDAVAVHGSITPAEQERLGTLLKKFHPWRKGPFELFGINLDTEWRSNLKWDRVAAAVDFRGKSVVDVGCGNGYYGWKMLDAGAQFVLGCEPYLLYVMQFEIFRRYMCDSAMHFVVPLADTDLPPNLAAFDIAVSMGVIYHRASPIDHLQTLWHLLRPSGELVLETLVIESDVPTVLMPKDRYAKMRNVWFVPSLAMLECWLNRTGFDNIQLADVSRTTTMEQRRTEWMTFESLEDFLDPNDAMRTVEGYPAPVRAVVTCKRS